MNNNPIWIESHFMALTDELCKLWGCFSNIFKNGIKVKTEQVGIHDFKKGTTGGNRYLEISQGVLRSLEMLVKIIKLKTFNLNENIPLFRFCLSGHPCVGGPGPARPLLVSLSIDL
jgi:hypothetical protein